MMLYEEHHKFLQTSQIANQKTIADWLYFFTDVRTIYEKRKKEATFYRRINFVLILTLIIVFFGGADLLGSKQNFVLAFCSLIAFLMIVLKIRKKMYAKDFFEKIDNFLLPLLRILAHDIKQDSFLSLQLDLRNPLEVSEVKEYQSNGWKIRLRKFNFLQMEVIFNEKITLNLAISDTSKDFIKGKTSASGRTKYKRKFKGKVTYTARLYFPKEKFSSSEQLTERKGKLMKTSKIVQTRTVEKYNIYQVQDVCQAISNAFASMTKVA